MNPAGARPPDLILASGSPRRTELLARLGIPHRVRPANIDEEIPEPDAERLVEHLALEKAAVIHDAEPTAVVLAADTTVVLDGRILGKPRDAAENAAFLEALSGRWHDVFTGVAIRAPAGTRAAVERTRVRFHDLSDDEIRGYVASGEGLDKAGGYGIQERGMALVKGIDGDFFNVVGLPVGLVLRLARSLGLELLPWLE